MRSVKLSLYTFKNLKKVQHRGMCKKAIAMNVPGDDSGRPSFMEDDTEQSLRRVKTNRSGLLLQDWKKVHNIMPYNEAHSWIHLKEKYQRKLYALHGRDCGVDPRICFPTKEDLRKKKDYEMYAEPMSLNEMLKKEELIKKTQYSEILKRENDIAKKLEKLEQWKDDLNTKVAKKEAETLAAKERKERLIEEVRRHFGFKVDPRDDRFKEMLEQKEKEDKKKQKEAKRKAKEEKMMSKLIEKNSDDKLLAD